MGKKPFGLVIEVVSDQGAYEAQNERVILLRTVGQMGKEATFTAYANGWPKEFQPGDRYDLVKRENTNA